MRIWFHEYVLRHRVTPRVLHRVYDLELLVHDCSCGKSWGQIRRYLR